MGYRDTFLNNYEDVEETSSPVTEVAPDGVVTVENHLDLSFLDSSPEMEESKVETTETSGISSAADSEAGYSNSGSSIGEYESENSDVFKLGKKNKEDTKYSDRMSLKDKRAQEALEKENAKYNIEMPHEDNSRAKELEKEREALDKQKEDYYNNIKTPEEAFLGYKDATESARGFAKKAGEDAKNILSLLKPSTVVNLKNRLLDWARDDKEDYTTGDTTYKIKGHNGKAAASFMEEAKNKLRNSDGSLNVVNLLASTQFAEGFKSKNFSATGALMDLGSTAKATSGFVKDVNEDIWENITPDDVYEMDANDLAVFAEALMYQNGSSPSRKTEELINALVNASKAYDIMPQIREIAKDYDHYSNMKAGADAYNFVADMAEDAMLLSSAVNAGKSIAGALKQKKWRGNAKYEKAWGDTYEASINSNIAKNAGRQVARALGSAASAGMASIAPNMARVSDTNIPELSDTAKSNYEPYIEPLNARPAARTLEDIQGTTSEDEKDTKRYGSDNGFESPKEKIIGTSSNMLKLRDKLKEIMKQKYDGTENQFAIGKLMDGEITDEDAERTLKGDAKAIKDIMKTLKEFRKEIQPWNLIKSLKERGLKGTVSHLVDDVFGGVNTGIVEEIEPLLREMTIELASENDPAIERPTEVIDNTSEYGIGDKTSESDEYNKGLKASDCKVKDFITKNIAKDHMLRSWAGKLKR